MDGAPQTHYAICIMHPDGDSGVKGIVKFMQTEGQKVKIHAEITGLTPGLHGFHIHQFGNLTEGCKTAGPHYNPHNTNHGGPTDDKENRHVGDLGNCEANAEGKAVYDWEDHLIEIHGPLTVVGRSCVCHADVDDLGKTDHPLSKTTGNAGARLACGVIGLSGQFEM